MRKVAILLFAFLIPILANGDDARISKTFSVEMRSEFQSMPGGSWQWAHRYVNFPKGCDYVSHEMEVLDRRPSDLDDDWPDRMVVNDTLGRNADGRVFTLLANIGAHRPIRLGPGFATITVRLSVVASCDESGLEEMAKQFG